MAEKKTSDPYAGRIEELQRKLDEHDAKLEPLQSEIAKLHAEFEPERQRITAELHGLRQAQDAWRASQA